MRFVQKPDPTGLSPATSDAQSSASESPASVSMSSQNRVMASDVKDKQRKLDYRKQGDPSVTNSYSEKGQTGELSSIEVGLSHIHLVREFVLLCLITQRLVD